MGDWGYGLCAGEFGDGEVGLYHGGSLRARGKSGARRWLHDFGLRLRYLLELRSRLLRGC